MLLAIIMAELESSTGEISECPESDNSSTVVSLLDKLNLLPHLYWAESTRPLVTPLLLERRDLRELEVKMTQVFTPLSVSMNTKENI